MQSSVFNQCSHLLRAKIEATHDINAALESGWQGLDIAEIVPLDQIARAHELVEHPAEAGRVILAI